MVALDVLEDVHQRALPGGSILQSLGGLMLQKPVEQVINILEVVVEGLPIDFAVLHDLLYRDVVQKLFLEQMFEGIGQGKLCAGSQWTHLLPSEKRRNNWAYYTTGV